MKDDLFESIDKEKVDLPLLNKRIKEVEKYQYNFYQKVAIFTMIVFFFVGILLGNLFPACQSGVLYSTICESTQFNIALTIIFWFFAFLVSLFIFFMGHVIKILESIDKKMKK